MRFSFFPPENFQVYKILFNFIGHGEAKIIPTSRTNEIFLWALDYKCNLYFCEAVKLFNVRNLFVITIHHKVKEGSGRGSVKTVNFMHPHVLSH